MYTIYFFAMAEQKTWNINLPTTEDYARVVLLFYWPKVDVVNNCSSEEWCLVNLKMWKACSLDTIAMRILNEQSYLANLAWATLYAIETVRGDIAIVFDNVIKKWFKDGPELFKTSMEMNDTPRYGNSEDTKTSGK